MGMFHNLEGRALNSVMCGSSLSMDRFRNRATSCKPVWICSSLGAKPAQKANNKSIAGCAGGI
jgi:hypothetical protein